MKKLTEEIVTAIGYLLTTYNSDLNYFLKFEEFNAGKISSLEYCQYKEGTFKKFVNEYGVARRFEVKYTKSILESALGYCRNEKQCEIDKLAKEWLDAGFTRGREISLASKVMMLMFPHEMMPFDSRAKKALGKKIVTYEAFNDKVIDFQISNRETIEIGILTALPLLEPIEEKYIGKLERIPEIRLNRFIDKLLWVKGA